MANYIAHIKYLKIAPRKMRLIGDTLTGLPVREAEAQLLHRPQRAAKPLLKLVRSAVANARNIDKTMTTDRLSVERVRVDQGPVLKRSLPRAMGRATPILKRMSNVSVTLKVSEAPVRERFTIRPPEKKTKTPKQSTKKPKEATKEEGRKTSGEKQGFLKRVFHRKAI